MNAGKGTVKIALCDGQSGTKALSMDDWNFSWKLVHQAAEVSIHHILQDEVYSIRNEGFVDCV